MGEEKNVDGAQGTRQAPSAGLDHERRSIISGVLIAMLLAAVDQASVAPAVAIIGRDLGDTTFLSWVVSAYFVTATSVTTLYGRIADIHGRRPTLFAAIGTFLFGSLVSASAPDLFTLIAGRAIQGLGGGGLLVLAMTVIGDVVPPIERGRYAAYVSGAWAFASIAGPVIGGMIAEHAHWRVIFLLNIPLGALALLICNRPLRKLVWHRRDHKLDLLGSVLVVSATVTLMLALTWAGPRSGWASKEALGLLALAASLAFVFVRHLRRSAEPLIAPGLLRQRTIAAAATGSFCVMATYTGLTVFLPIYLQMVHGLTASTAGLALIAFMAGAVIGSMVSARFMNRVARYRLIAVAGVAVAAASLGLLAASWAHLPLWLVEVAMLAVGIGLGTNFPITTVSVQNVVELKDLGTATGVLQFMRSLGSAIGIAAMGAAAALSGVASGLGRGTTGASGTMDGVDFAPVLLLGVLFSVIALACIFLIEDKPLRAR